MLHRVALLEAVLRPLVDAGDGAGSPRGAGLLDELPAAPPPLTDPQLQDRCEQLDRDTDDDRLVQLGTVLGLTRLDLELLVLAAAPDIDPSIGARYAALHGHELQTQLSTPLAMWLLGLHTANGHARERYGEHGPLAAAGLIVLDPPKQRWVLQHLRVPERVVRHLLGSDRPDQELAQLLVRPPSVPGSAAERLARALAAGAPLTYLQDGKGGVGAGAARAAFAELGTDPVTVDLARAAPGIEVAALARDAAREARLRGTGLVVTNLDVLLEDRAHEVRHLAEAPGQVVLVGRAVWDPDHSRTVPVVVRTEPVSDQLREQLWSEAIGHDLAAEIDAVGATRLFRLGTEQIQRAAEAARGHAVAAGRAVVTEDLLVGARRQNSTRLARLARRIEPRSGWDDLVLPPEIEAMVRDLTVRWRRRDRVLDDWQLSRGTARGRGVSALFSGPSGTGKTLSAEVIAFELGLDLYIVELSTVIDKYIGETSKNLERIFDEADRVNGVLLFDEADALFGKRSSVSDSKDRHANVEVAYLLQRMEAFDGIAILTTNLASNLDDAFLRRLDAIIDYPAPTEQQRRMMWQRMLPTAMPVDEDLDLELLATRFELSGSEIRNVVASAAYLAADDDRAVTMRDLVVAVVREHRKMGRHLSPMDLDGFQDLLTA